MVLLLVAVSAEAQTQLRAQVIGNGGVSFATSGTSTLGATIGQAVVGITQNGTTKISQGFWYYASKAVDVREVSAPVPTALVLEQNYPNPFNPSTTIRFSVPEGSSEVRLNVYNALGVMVKTLVSGTSMKEGVYEATFDGTGLTSGVYMYELHVGSRSMMKKMIMSK